MSEMEMNNDVETDDFTDELSDEALDREGAKFSAPGHCATWARSPFRAGN
jgi:hypothetical protein